MPAERHLGGFLIVDHEADAAGRPGAMRPVGHGRSAVTRGRIGAPWVLVDAARACRCAGAWFRRPLCPRCGPGPAKAGPAVACAVGCAGGARRSRYAGGGGLSDVRRLRIVCPKIQW